MDESIYHRRLNNPDFDIQHSVFDIRYSIQLSYNCRNPCNFFSENDVFRHSEW